MKAYNGFKQFINNDATKTKNNTSEFMNCEKSVNNNIRLRKKFVRRVKI